MGENEEITRVVAFIPALNEEDSIANVINRIREVYKDSESRGFKVELLVVDDGSKDLTHVRAKEAGAELVRHPWNLGKGCALDTGFKWAAGRGYRFVVTLDGDGQHDPRDIRTLFQASEDYDIVVGTRLGDLANMPTKNKMGNLLSTRWISKAARTHVGDSQSGFRLIPVKVWMDLDLTTTGFETETEMLIQAGRKGYRIGAVPVRTIYTGEENSKFRAVRDSLRIGSVLFRYWCADLISRRGRAKAR